MEVEREMNFVVEPEKRVPVVYDVDVAVAGGPCIKGEYTLTMDDCRANVRKCYGLSMIFVMMGVFICFYQTQ